MVRLNAPTSTLTYGKIGYMEHNIRKVEILDLGRALGNEDMVGWPVYSRRDFEWFAWVSRDTVYTRRSSVYNLEDESNLHDQNWGCLSLFKGMQKGHGPSNIDLALTFRASRETK